MTVPTSPTVPRASLNQWEDDGGAIPSVANFPGQCSQINVGNAERIASAIAGGAMLLHGLTRGSWSGLITAALGGGLLYRGVTGHCQLYESLDISTADEPSEKSATRSLSRDSEIASSQQSTRRASAGDRSTQSTHMHGPAPTPGPSPVPTQGPPFVASSSATIPQPPERRLEATPGSPPPGRT